MNVLILSNGELKEKALKNSLEALQQIVGGYIEIPFISQKFLKNAIDIIINEEGKYIEGLKPEIVIANKETNQTLDIIYGNCVFASHDNRGNTISLNDDQRRIITEELKDVIVTKDTGEMLTIKALFI